MSKTIEIKDIAQWEENDSELAKYTIQQLLKTYDDLEEQYKLLMKQIIEQDKRIDKAIEYINKLQNFKIKYVMLEEKELYASEKDFVKDILDILRGKDNDSK